MFGLGIFEVIILAGIILTIIGVPVIVLIVVLATRKKRNLAPPLPPRGPESPYNRK